MSVAAARAAKKAERGRQLLHKYATGIPAKLRPFILSPQGKAMFAGFAAGLMLVSGVPSNLHVQAALIHNHETALSGNNTTATVPPYSLNVSQFPSPDPISQKGNFSLPRLGTTVFGGVPTYLLLSAGDAYRPETANISLRLAGSPVNAVNISLVENGTPLTTGTNLRTPGPPNVIHLPPSHLLLIPNYVVATSYAPDHGAGKVGANPAWLFVNFSGAFVGSASFFHVFNSRHPGSYQWNVSLASNMTRGIAESGIQARLSGSHLYLRTGTYSGLLAQERIENIVPGCSGVCPLPNIPILWASPTPVPGYNFSITGDDLAVNGSLVMVAGSGPSSTLVSASQNGGTNWTAVGSATGASPRLALSQNGTLLSTLQGGQAYATVFGLTNQTTAPVPLGPALNATPIWNSAFMGVLVSGTFSATTWDQKSVQVSGVACFTSGDGGASFSQHAPATYQSIARNLSLSSVDPIFNSIGQTSLGYPGGEPGQLGALSRGAQVLTVFTSSENGEVVPVVATSSDGCSHWTSTTPAPPPSGGSVMDPQVVQGPDGNVYLAWREDGLGGWTEDLATFSLSGHTISAPLRLPGSQALTAEAPALTVDSFNRPVLVWATNASTGSSGWVSGGFLSPTAIQQAWAHQLAQLQPEDMANLSASNLSTLRQDLAQLGTDLSNGSVTAAAQQVAAVYPRVTNGTLLLANSTLCPLVGGGCVSIVPPAVPLWVLNLTGVLAPDQYFEDYADLEFEALGLAVLSPPPGDPVVGFPPPPPPPPSGGGPGSSGGGPITVSGATSVSVSESFINPITGELVISWTFPGYSQGHTYWANGAICPPGSPPHGSRVTFGWSNLSLASSFAVGVSSGTGTQTFATSAQSIIVYLTNLPEGAATGWSVAVGAHYSQTDIYTDGCNPANDMTVIVNPPTISPININAPLSGSIDVELTMTPGNPDSMLQGAGDLVQLQTDGSGQDIVNLEWSNSLPAFVQPPPCLESGSATPCPGSQTTGYVPSGTWGHTPPYPPAIPPTESFSFSPDVQVGTTTYTAFASVSTDNATTWTTGNVVAVGPAPGSSAPLTAQLSCSFQATTGPAISNLQDTEEGQGIYLVSWDSTVGTPGIIQWTDEEFGGSQRISNLQSIGTSGSLYQFQTVIRGLSDFDVYSVQVFSSASSANTCASNFVTAPLSIVTPSNFVLQEQDQPYDSVTQEGGGASLFWNVPAAFLDHSSYDSGYLVYDPLGDPTDSIQVPLPSLPARSSTYGAMLEELTTLTPGTTYSVAMTLNFTENSVPVAATSNPLSFTYLKDTSGDGLSDAEKALGWTATPTDVNGNSVNEQVTADVNSYATNGLVNDLIEKKFGLDPRTIDTSGSHMLDTWNLTFQLPSATCPSGFECWDESSNGAFNPFTVSEFPGATAPCTVGSPPPGWTSQCAPSGAAPGNFSQASVGFTGPDSSPWGSNQLWSYSELQVLQGLIPSSDGYLRGVLSDASGVGPAVTVWGKLSWGANPLAASTPSDGIADGARVNPLYEEALQLQFTNPLGTGGGGAFLTYKGSEIQDCNGYAVRYWANDSSGTPEYQAYTSAAFAQVTAKPKACPNGPFAVLGTAGAPQTYTLPVPQTSQVQHLDLQMLVNLALDTTSFKLEQIPIYGCALSYGLNVDMVAPPSEDTSSSILAYALQGGTQPSPSASGCPREPQTNGFLDFGVTAVPSGVKAPTFLWVPSDNSTLSSLPMGLQRYTGEQDFVLVTADMDLIATSGVGPGYSFLTSDPIANPWGDPNYLSTYQLTLHPGLNNFLVPRSQFLASPLGEAVLQNQLVDPNAASMTGPFAFDTATQSLSTTNLLSGKQGGAVIPALSPAGSVGGQANLASLACYWQDRAVISMPNPSQLGCSSSELGTSHPDNNYFQDVSVAYNDATGCPGINCGGVPSNPAIESSCTPAGSCEAPAVQAVVTVHLTCANFLSSPNCVQTPVDPSEFDALLAGLLYDAQGGASGYFMDVTRAVPSLGLLPAVTEALANAVQPSAGVFGAPVSLAQPPPPPPPSCSGFSCVWNTVSGALLELGQTIVNGLIGLAGTIWNDALSVANYFANIVAGLANLVMSVARAAVDRLEAVGAALAAALQALAKFITDAIKSIITAVLTPISNALRAIYDGMGSLLSAASNATMAAFESQGSSSLASQEISGGLGGLESSVSPLVSAVNSVQSVASALSIGGNVIAGFITDVIRAVFSLFPSVPGASSVESAVESDIGTVTSFSFSLGTTAAGYLFDAIESSIFGSSMTFSSLGPASPYTSDFAYGPSDLSTHPTQTSAFAPFVGAVLGSASIAGAIGRAAKSPMVDAGLGLFLAFGGFLIALQSLTANTFDQSNTFDPGCHSVNYGAGKMNWLLTLVILGALFGGSGIILDLLSLLGGEASAILGAIALLVELVALGWSIYEYNEAVTCSTTP